MELVFLLINKSLYHYLFLSYRKNPQKRLLYAITAFSLFGVFLTYENFEHVLTFEYPFADITIPALTLAILVLFFLAITKRN